MLQTREGDAPAEPFEELVIRRLGWSLALPVRLALLVRLARLIALSIVT